MDSLELTEYLAIVFAFQRYIIGHVNTQTKAVVIRTTIAVYKTTAKFITITKSGCGQESLKCIFFHLIIPDLN